MNRDVDVAASYKILLRYTIQVQNFLLSLRYFCFDKRKVQSAAHRARTDMCDEKLFHQELIDTFIKLRLAML